MANRFDDIGIMVDWLDACRAKNVDALIDLYAPNATLKCDCYGTSQVSADELKLYWQSKLTRLPPETFQIDALLPVREGMALDYYDLEGNFVRMVFSFNSDGKILYSYCKPHPGNQ